MEVKIGDRQVIKFHAKSMRTTRKALPTEAPGASERPRLTNSRLSFLVSPLLAAQWYRNSGPYYHLCERLWGDSGACKGQEPHTHGKQREGLCVDCQSLLGLLCC